MLSADSMQWCSRCRPEEHQAVLLSACLDSDTAAGMLMPVIVQGSADSLLGHNERLDARGAPGSRRACLTCFTSNAAQPRDTQLSSSWRAGKRRRPATTWCATGRQRSTRPCGSRCPRTPCRRPSAPPPCRWAGFLGCAARACEQSTAVACWLHWLHLLLALSAAAA